MSTKNASTFELVVWKAIFEMKSKLKKCSWSHVFIVLNVFKDMINGKRELVANTIKLDRILSRYAWRIWITQNYPIIFYSVIFQHKIFHLNRIQDQNCYSTVRLMPWNDTCFISNTIKYDSNDSKCWKKAVRVFMPKKNAGFSINVIRCHLKAYKTILTP